MIDKQSPVPIYFQIEEQIKQQIENGDLQQGDVIPSEREYTEKYNISRMTVRQAINNLVNEGYLYREKGRGTFVARKKIEQPLVGLTSFTEDMKARGMKPGSKLVSFDVRPASDSVAGHLEISKDDPVYKIVRVRLADDAPMAVETNYISINLVKGLTKELADQSLYEYVENQLNLKIGQATQTVESSLAREDERMLLGIEKKVPILLIERHTLLDDGTPFEFVKSTYRGDRYKFVIQMNR